jgi:hypothetical protein
LLTQFQYECSSAQAREAAVHVEEGDNVPAAASGYTYMTPELQAEVETHWTKDGDIDKSTRTDSRLRQNVFSKLGVDSPITSN